MKMLIKIGMIMICFPCLSAMASSYHAGSIADKIRLEKNEKKPPLCRPICRVTQ